MFCPYPTTCIYDRFQHTGVHSCATPRCPFAMTAKTLLEREIQLLDGIEQKTKGHKKALARLREKYRIEFGGDPP